jgi:hypothetical protein
MKKHLNSLLFLCGLVTSATAGAEIHALLMFIGDYRAGIPKLEGVQHDVPSARSIAHLMGVKDENMLSLQDKELTLDGMRNAFDELDRRVNPGDKVFIYYSGHGGRQWVQDPEDRCAESLVTVDGNFFLDAELEARLQKLSGRTQKIIAMLDSCHSGGTVTRSMNRAKYTPKYWSKGEQDACSEPRNLLTRSINKDSRSAGSGGKNYVYIAAAKNDEVSLDSEMGGFATMAWVQCMSGEAVDSDGSGGLTAEEIRVCAQQKIDVKTKDIEGVLPQHISIVGNPDLVMTLASKKSDAPQEPDIQPPASPAPVPPSPIPAPVSSSPIPAPVISVAPVLPIAVPVAPAPPAPVSQEQVAQEQVAQVMHTESGAPATLLDIFNGRDDRRMVVITPNKNKLKIGNDKFSFSVRSSHDGYLYLMMVGSDGNTFDLLFPNKLDGNNYIQAGQTVQFPRSSWEIIAQGPAGKDHILAIVADAPRDLANLPLVNAGPFSMVNATSGGKRGIQMMASTRSAAIQDECGNTGRRNLAVARVCSDAYGAAMAVVEEAE